MQKIQKYLFFDLLNFPTGPKCDPQRGRHVINLGTGVIYYVFDIFVVTEQRR